jgi:hypothetical protein
MAVLEHVATRNRITLVGHSLIGRSSKADVQLKANGASKEHATVSWDGGQWHLKDLASLNGTKVNGESLSSRVWPLTAGDLLVFGDPAETWCWVDGEAPKAYALDEDGGRLHCRDGLLLLPNEDAPHASIYARDQEWELELDGKRMHVASGDIIEVGARRFRLVLPVIDHALEATRMLQPTLARIATSRLLFKVSSDEERVQVAVCKGDEQSSLPSRSFHYMLLTLARAKISDLKNGVPDEDAGWLYTEDLAAGLLTTSEKVNVDVHRARRLVAKLSWFEDPEALIERRADTAQLRLGVAQSEVALLTRA